MGKNSFGVLAAALALAGGGAPGTAAAQEGNLACMPKIMHHAVKAFQHAREKGIQAVNAEGEVFTFQAQDVIVKGVEVRDLHKNAYVVRFRVASFALPGVAALESVVHSVNYAKCYIDDAAGQLAEPGYQIR
jgi:hypothetical protein